MSKKENYITVTQLNTQIKNTLAENFSNQLKIKGELSNLKMSGPHTYLTLKDNDSSINVVFWNYRLENINNGDDVLVTGKITCFIKGGNYQVTASKIERIGIGNLHEILENNKNIFLQKGYFEKSIKQSPLPDTINNIGILTAREGAALQDIMYVLKKNMFTGNVYIKNCIVQGQNCPESVKKGVEYFNDLNKTTPIDVLIVTRGGGSFEDLIGYSSKEIVRAIHKTSIYTISAVGHEVDTMLSDFSANYRAPTPSIAGDTVSYLYKKRRETLSNNLDFLNRLKIQIKNKFKNNKELIKSLIKISNSANPIDFLTNEMNKINNSKIYLRTFVKNKLDNHKNKIINISAKNDSFNPSNIFENGYVAIVDKHNNLINTLSSFNEIYEKKQKLKIVFVDGEFELSLNTKK